MNNIKLKHLDSYSPPAPLKILFFSHSFYPQIGGIESISDMLAYEFEKAGHEVRLFTWSTDTGNKVFPFSVTRRPGILTLFKEFAWADIVFENNPCMRMSWISIFFKRKSIIGLQTWISRMDGSKGWQDRLKLLFLKRARFVIACSDSIGKRYFQNSIVIGNPYNESIFKIIPGIPKSGDFIFLGRLVSDKGADIIIKAFSKILKMTNQNENTSFSNLKLTIVGDGPERKSLEEMVAQLELNRNILFTGALTGDLLVTSLNQHRFIVVPSRWAEPFGIVALEGMACGCLPLVSNGGGLPDAVGNAGILFKQGDVDDLADCIIQILKDPVKEKILRNAAPLHLETHKSYEVSQQYLSIFNKVYNNIA